MRDTLAKVMIFKIFVTPRKQHILPSTGLRDSITTSLKNTKRTLVAHSEQTSQGEFQHYALFECHKISYIFKNKEAWSIVVTVRKIRDN